MKTKPPGVKTPPQLKKRLDDFIPIHERPVFAREIAALQEPTDEGTGQQDMVEAMDQSGSHVSPLEVSSSSRSTRSGMQSEACAAAELAAVQ